MSFSLTAEGETTLLRVTEGGFGVMVKPDPEKADYYEAHYKGWDAHLASLQRYIATRP